MPETGGTPITVHVDQPRRSSSLGIASLVLGILALLVCWVPFLGTISLPLSGLGLLLGLVGLIVAATRRGAGVGFPIAGMAVSGLAFVIAFFMTSALTKTFSSIGESARKRQETNQKVVTTASPSAPAPATAVPASAAPLPGAASTSAASSKADEEWAPADKPVKQGDVQIQAVSVRVGKVRVRDRIRQETATSKEPLLSVALKATNLSTTKKIDYHTWAGREFSLSNDKAKLTDNFGNRYKTVTFGFDPPVGRTESASVYPGKPVEDVLVFEAPLNNVEYLNLELPAENVGGEGMFRLRIPASMIQRK